MRLEARATRMAFLGIRAAVAQSAIAPDLQMTASYYLLNIIGNVPAALIAEARGCSKQNISKALPKVEDRRDADPIFGAELDRLEAALTEAW